MSRSIIRPQALSKRDKVLQHAGIDAEGLPKDLDCHHLFVNDWDDIEAEQNVCIASIPTVFNPGLAPEGKAVVHAYCAANEPYSHWEGLDRRSQEYRDLKVTSPYRPSTNAD